MHPLPGRPTVAEVSLAALRANCRHALACVGPRARVLAVVKADAYGHGAVASARAFLEAGAAGLGVSTVAEGVELRRAGLAADVVVLGGVFAGEEEDVVAHGLAAAAWTLDQVRALSGRARAAGRTVALHVKVNSGMTRLGLDVDEVRAFGEAVRGVPAVRIAGLFAHFASADAPESASVDEQVRQFTAAVDALAAAGIRPEHVHHANSAAVLAKPAAHFTMVRPGLMLYGCAPAPHLDPERVLRPAMRLRSGVAQVRRVPRGTAVGYGGTWVAARPSAIAVLPCGYADGFHRLNSNRARVLVRGQAAPVAGRVCMDHLMLDVTDVPGVAAGDPAVLLGRHGEAQISADDVAAWSDTIAYEVLTSIGKRVPRVYVEEFDA